MKATHRLMRIITLVMSACLASGLFTASVRAQDGGPAAAPDEADAVQAVLGSTITYQGGLKKSGQPVNATCSFQFSLWDAASGGAQKGTTQTVDNVTVQAGSFTVQLNFGNQFTGDARWIQTAVRCAGDGGYTALAPRQSLNAAPYAIGLRPGAVIQSAASADTLYVEKTAANSVAIRGKATQTGGTGVLGESTSWAGVWGQSTSASGVVGRSAGQFAGGVYGENTGAGYGVYGKSQSGAGVVGESATWVGVYGKSTDHVGVMGESEDSNGVYGKSRWAPGVLGLTSFGSAVRGESPAGTGVEGFGIIGVSGEIAFSDGQAIRGNNGGSNTVGYAGYFLGRVQVTGNLIKGGGSFKIDHPLDPQGKYLSHSFVESPDMMNIYNGNITTDAQGFATVVLPDWFQALNGGAEHRADYRYQLTVIGQFAQAIVAEEISGNRFRIQTDKPGVKVSWQVTGIRHDPYAEQNRIVVEENKPAAERGKYLYPAAYGRPQSEGIAALTAPRASAPAAPEGVQP